jgi:hypothetical protein
MQHFLCGDNFILPHMAKAIVLALCKVKLYSAKEISHLPTQPPS